MTSNRYTREFKLDAASLVLDQGYSHVEAARSLEINPNMLSRWIKEHDSDDGHAFQGNGKLTPEKAEIRLLKKRGDRSVFSARGWLAHAFTNEGPARH